MATSAPGQEKRAAVSEGKLDEIESDTLRNAARTVSIIENAISAWNAAKVKPRNMASALERLKRFRSALVRWGAECAVLRAGRADMEHRVGMLREFVEICYAYENA